MKSRSAIRTVCVIMFALLASQGVAPGATLKTRTVKQNYVGSIDPLTGGFCKRGRVPENIGMVCVPLKSKDKKIAITITDQVLGNPAFFYMFVDAGGGCVGDTGSAADACPNTGSGCGSAKNIIKPKGAVALEIYANGLVLGPLKCTVLETTDSPGTAVAGTITAKIQYLR